MQGAHNHPKPGMVRGQSAAASRERAALRPPSPVYASAAAFQPPVGGRPPSGLSRLSQHAHVDQQDGHAAEALQLIKTGFSPEVALMGPPVPHDTPTALLPIPASLRASAEPEGLPKATEVLRNGVNGASGLLSGADGSDLSGWRCCAVCGIKLDASLPLAAWHYQQQMQQPLQNGQLGVAAEGHAHATDSQGHSPGLCAAQP